QISQRKVIVIEQAQKAAHVGGTHLICFETQQDVRTQAVLQVPGVDKIACDLPGEKVGGVIALLPAISVERKSLGRQIGELRPASRSAYRGEAVISDNSESLAQSAHTGRVLAVKERASEPHFGHWLQHPVDCEKAGRNRKA